MFGALPLLTSLRRGTCYPRKTPSETDTVTVSFDLAGDLRVAEGIDDVERSSAASYRPDRGVVDVGETVLFGRQLELLAAALSFDFRTIVVHPQIGSLEAHGRRAVDLRPDRPVLEVVDVDGRRRRRRERATETVYVLSAARAWPSSSRH
jgi:hypothetical protein